MAIDLRRDLLDELSTRISTLADAGSADDPADRDAIRLGLYRGAQAMVKTDRDIVPELVRIADRLYEVDHGQSPSCMELGRGTRRFWLVEAAVNRFIVYGATA